MTTRGLLFGAAATSYERYRLGYPEAVADLVFAYADPPLARAVEVGAGTGKATRLLAGRGVHVTACEPDPQMAAVLAEQTAGLPVEVAASTFEDLLPDAHEPFDLLYAAAAWHWTAPETRWTQAAALVRRGGTLAFFGSGGSLRTQLEDPELQEAAEQARRTMMPDESHITHERSASGLWWPVSEIEDDPRFGDIEEHDVARHLERSRDDFVGHLATMSHYLLLPPEDRAEVLRRIGEVLPDVVAVRADLRVHLVRRR